MKGILKDAAILFVITLVAGLCLGAVHEVTLDPIAKAQEAAATKTYKEVFPEAAKFEQTDELTAAVAASADEILAQGFGNVSVDDAQVAEAEDGSFSIDEEKVKEYVAGLAKKYDTVNSKRTFTTTAGNTVTLTPGDYGWEIDQSGTESNLMQAINDGTQGDFEIVYTSTALSRNENDIGNSYVELSLSDQHFWVYVDGKQVMDSEVVTGCRNKGTETPKGVYKVKGKTTDYTMRGEKNASGNWSYQVHCNYWIPFAAEDTIGFHDLTTRSDWSSTAYLDNGSHGCVNTPLDKVKELYDIVSYKFPVVIY